MLTLEQLTTPVTEDDALDTILQILSQLGFQATAWESGSIQLIMLRLIARVWSRVTDTITQIARGGFTTLAGNTDGTRSPYLTLLATHVYNIERLEAQYTIGKVLLTSSAGAPIHTFAAGDIIVANAEDGDDDAVTFINTEGGTLNPASSLSIEFKASVAGAASNIAPATPLFLWTPLVGVTPTNPALVPDSNTWITTPGADEESDDRLMARCIAKWARLSYGNVQGAYVGWALEALPALTRVQVAGAAGNGTVRIIGATALGAIDASQITIIQDYVNGVSDGVGRRPINDIVTAQGAVTVTTPAITVTAYATASAQDTAASVISAALLTFFGSLPIGGVRLQGNQGRVLFDDIMDVAKHAKDGVRSVDLSITDDVLLSEGQIYTPSVTVNVLPVAPGAI